MTSVSLKRFDVVDIKILLDYLEENSLGIPRLWRMILADDELRKRLDKYKTNRGETSRQFRKLLDASNLAGDESVHYLKKDKEYIPSERNILRTIWEDDKSTVGFTSLRLHEDVDSILLITEDKNGFQTHWRVDASAFARILLRYPFVNVIKRCSDSSPWIYFFDRGKQVACTDADYADEFDDDNDIEDLDEE